MYHYQTTIAYKGTHYFGWQDLGAIEQKPTIQACIHKALKKICDYQECTVSGASRTDAGVHAQGQIAKLTLPIEINAEKLQLGMNSLLPEDIRVQQCTACHKEFNPNQHSLSKEYHYYFSTGSITNPALCDIISHIPLNHRPCNNKTLDISAMKLACHHFVGEHDFYSFATRDSSIASTIRSISHCEILNADFSDFNGETYCLKIIGNGFLKHMVRYISGALFELGRGNININQITEALEKPQKDKLSPKSKAKGLHLIRINF